MSRPSEWEDLQNDILGLGQTSLRKTHYASLRQRLKELERFRAAIDLSTDLFFILSYPSACIADVNQVASTELGIDRTELIGTCFAALLGPEDQHRFGELLRNFDLLNGGQGVLAAQLCGAGSLAIPVEIAARLVPGRDSSVVLSARNISERIRTEEERERLETQLRQSQKLEAIGLLAGGVAHDFNNLLTVILGYLGLLRAAPEGPEASPQMLEEIQKAAERASSLTNQLLAFSRKQVLQPAVLDLNALVANVTRLLRRVIGEHIDFRTEPGESLACILADPTQVEQVILNLAVNARDAMPSGGQLIVSTANVSKTEDGLIQTAPPPGKYVMLSVRDTGVGMDELTRQRVFEPFFTTKERGRGTGLGLSTVYGIVRQSEGHIAVSSRVGEGSEFRVYFPAVEGQADRHGEGPEARLASAASETVLLVEDEESVRKLAETILQGEGYHVVAARDGAEALRLCNSHYGRIEITVTDLIMPGMQGSDLAQAIKTLRPEMKILFISGYAAGAMELQEGSSFLQKPFTPASLLAKVREVLDKNATEGSASPT